VLNSVNDFHLIKMKNERLSAKHFNQLHQTCFDFLQQAVKQNPDTQKVIVTHHVPTLMNYPAQYKNSPINEAFAVELYPFIEFHNAAHWIYGHHHVNIHEFSIGNTHMHTNQLGYVKQNEQKKFNPNTTIEL